MPRRVVLDHPRGAQLPPVAAPFYLLSRFKQGFTMELREMRQRGELANDKNKKTTTPGVVVMTLKDLGISRNESKKAGLFAQPLPP